MISSSVQTKVDALLVALDEDIQSTESTLSQLDVLRSLIIKRDDKTLETLLHDLQEQAESRLAAIRRREAIRKELADELGWERGAMTLSALRRVLVDPQRQAVVDRQTRLKGLVAQLKREYALTTALVADCARFNRSLMRVFFGQEAQGEATYNARGTMSRPANTSLVDLHY